MKKNTDWEAWDLDFGPRSHLEARQLKTVAEGAVRSGPFFGNTSPNSNAWLISRDRQRHLRLEGEGARKGFVQFLWYYTSGQRPFQKAPGNLEILFN